MNKKRTLSTDFLAALTAGAVSADVAETLASEAEEVSTEEKAVEAKAETEELELAKGEENEETVEAEEGAEREETAPEVSASSETTSLVAHLREELRDTRKEVTALSIEKANLESQLAQLNTDLPGLTGIVRKSVEVMSIALGTKAVGLDSMSNEALCEYYNQLSNEMAKKFPVGGRAVTTAKATEDTSFTASNDSPARRAAVKSSSIK